MNSNAIPTLAYPLGLAWNQPSLSAILIDDTHALMTAATFRELQDYRANRNSGIYPGKMWKLYDGASWLLCWYGLSEKWPNRCPNNYRQIILVDGDVYEIGRVNSLKEGDHPCEVI